MKYNYLIISILIIIIFALLFLEFNQNKKSELVRDTLYIEYQAEPIEIIKYKPKIIYLKDTLIETKPFRAEVDTTLNMDTITASYIFPENEFNLNLKHNKDTLKYIQTIFGESQEPLLKYNLISFIFGLLLALILI